MDYLIYIIPIIMTTTLLRIILRDRSYKNLKEIKPTIKQPKLYYESGLIIVILALITILLILIYPSSMPLSEKIIATSGIFSYSMIGFILIYYYRKWGIQIEADHFIFTRFIGNKKIYKYDQCQYYPQSAHTIIYHSNNIIIRIPYLTSSLPLTRHLKVIDSAEAIKQHNPKIQIKYNYMTLIFGLTFSILGMLLIAPFAYALFISVEGIIENQNDVIFGIVAAIFGSITLILGIFFILLYSLFRVTFSEQEMHFRNIIGKKRIFARNEIQCEPTNHGYRIRHKQKRVTYINEGLVDNTFLLRNLGKR